MLYEFIPRKISRVSSAREEDPLTPDRIRYAILGVHTVFFTEDITQKTGSMESALSEDAQKTFTALGFSLNRNTKLTLSGCV